MASISGHDIRPVRTPFGQLFHVGKTDRAFAKIEDAAGFGRKFPAFADIHNLAGLAIAVDGMLVEHGQLAALGRRCWTEAASEALNLNFPELASMLLVAADRWVELSRELDGALIAKSS